MTRIKSHHMALFACNITDIKPTKFQKLCSFIQRSVSTSDALALSQTVECYNGINSYEYVAQIRQQKATLQPTITPECADKERERTVDNSKRHKKRT